jgi:L-ascorbate metabolism protein UlaG (beta-lactamase superfamily)
MRRIKFSKRMMIISVSIVVLLTASASVYIKNGDFGKSPSKERLDRIKKSPNYKNGQFQNLQETTVLVKGYSMFDIAYKQFFKPNPRRVPPAALPSVKTNLLTLPADSDILVWFGHSSYFMQVDGKKYLVDPVFSGNASPVPGTMRAFKGTDVYAAADFPEIDYLLITHDHYDHLDRKTVVALKSKVKKVICGLGVGSHLEHWGYSPDQIIEKDWHEKEVLDSTTVIYAEPTRHMSGRGLSRNNTLWVSFVLKTATKSIYMSGDGGYGTHFAEIGKQHGPFDLAILENGQYNLAWQNIHMLPDEVLKAAQDLKAKRILPVHSAKFALASHAWDEPVVELVKLNEAYHFPLLMPMIGQKVNLDIDQVFPDWRKNVN